MEEITMKEFLLRQPNFPKQSETDDYYLDVANALLKVLSGTQLAADMEPGLVRKIALTLTDYLQDIGADAGLWRSFVLANRELYGWSVPFHDIPESYIDYELNREDVRFLVWYCIAMLWEEKRLIFPHDDRLLQMADMAYEYLDSVYEDAPVNETFNITRGLEWNDPNDREGILHLGNWLFLHSYLLTPAYSTSLREILMSVDHTSKDADVELNNRLEEAMMQDSTGPLALFTPEWVYLMIEGKLPPHAQSEGEDTNVHPYYEKFVNATGGKTLKFFGNYDEMNDFFISALGWEPGKLHLEQVADSRDFVLMVDRHKGMLMARDINRCIASPENPYYDKAYAADHAIELLTGRGVCPGDLLRCIFEHDWLPDAHFPGSDDNALVKDNRDFMARCFLQLYYRGD